MPLQQPPEPLAGVEDVQLRLVDVQLHAGVGVHGFGFDAGDETGFVGGFDLAAQGFDDGDSGRDGFVAVAVLVGAEGQAFGADAQDAFEALNLVDVTV